ncbi:MAG: hypothetical protein IPJ88_18320 [Myxococcales bacterium]|nr:MAG: hypothetical protein IPJ88_18320 [Myxococcales bacterium]
MWYRHSVFRDFRKNAPFIALVATATFAQMACVDRELKPITPCTMLGTTVNIQQNPTNKVDLLFVIDNSRSMRDEQQELANKIKRMVDVLSTGDLDPDDDQDLQSFSPVEDLHVGVLSTDMGGGGECTELGDDGLLQTVPDPTDPASCDTSYPSFLTFGCDQDTGVCTPTQAQLSDEVSCLVQVGIGGCNNEQALESLLKGLSDPATEEPVAFLSGAGHGGDGANTGFLRSNTVLAIVLLSDEDDCSARDTAIFASASQDAYLTPENDEWKFNTQFRCSDDPKIGWGADDAVYTAGGFEGTNTGILYPVSRYVDGLLKLRSDRPDLLVFAAITGVPSDLVSSRDSGGRLVFDYEAILNDPRMQHTVKDDLSGQVLPIDRKLEPACNPARPDGLDAASLEPPIPARRITRLARDLDEATGEQTSVLQSICEEDFTDALDAIIGRISDRLGNVCLPRDLSKSADGRVNCAVVETLAAEGSVDTITEYTPEQLEGRGREFVRSEEGRNVYRVAQLSTLTEGGGCAVPEGAGWFYDDCSAEVIDSCGEGGQRIRFKEGSEAPPAADIHLECFQPTKQVVAGDTGTLGGPCSAGELELCATWPDSLPDGDKPFLRCEPTGQTCQYYCENDAHCPNTSFVCDTERRVCVNPTCNNL